MLSFSERLQFWCHCKQQLGEAWTPARLAAASGINRGWWHHWLTASVRLEAGERLPPSHQEPAAQQWALILASQLPDDFKAEFADKRPGPNVITETPNRVCAWCGRAFYSWYAEHYCSDDHFGRMQGYRRGLRRAARQPARKEQAG